MERQLRLFDMTSTRLTHGGTLTKRRRKVRRPLFSKKSIHLVMKARNAYGTKSLWHRIHRKKIEDLIRAKARENSVRLLEAVNMGNHIHLKIRFVDRKSFQRFLRTVTGLIARIVLKAEKGRPHKIAPRIYAFWDSLAYTRVLWTSLEELQLKGYFRANRMERQRGYRARQFMLDRFNTWIQELRARGKKQRQ